VDDGSVEDVEEGDVWLFLFVFNESHVASTGVNLGPCFGEE